MLINSMFSSDHPRNCRGSMSGRRLSSASMLYKEGKAAGGIQTGGCSKESCSKERKTKNEFQNNYDNINAGIKRNLNARASFKGNSMMLLHKMARFAEDNHVAADALFVLPVLCGLKPAVKLAMSKHAKTQEEKEKYQYQAAKSAASGLVAFAVSLFAGVIITAGMNKACDAKRFKIPEKIEQEAKAAVTHGLELLKKIKTKLQAGGAGSELEQQIEKFAAGNTLHLSVFNNQSGRLDNKAVKLFISNIEKEEKGAGRIVKTAIDEQKVLDFYTDTAKNAGKKLFQPIFMPLRAKITTASIPLFLGWLGLKKPKKNKTADKQTPVKPAAAADIKKETVNMNSRMNKDTKTKILFSPFLEDNK